jgi:hypothetical protein
MKQHTEDIAASCRFGDSPLFDAMERIAWKDARIIITTDHGSIGVKNAVEIVA